MTAKCIRPLLSDDLLTALCGSFSRGGGAEEHLALMTGDYADLYGDAWRTVTGQADEIGKRALAILENTVRGREKLHLILDGLLVAEALAVATDEVLRPDVIEHLEALRELEEMGVRDTYELDTERDSHLSAVERQLVRNGLLVGKSRPLARLQAVVSGRQMRGRRSSPNTGAADETIFALGTSAAASAFPRKQASARDFKERLLGAAALGAVRGFIYGWDKAQPENVFKIELSGVGEDWDDTGPVAVVLNRARTLTVSRRLLDTLSPMTMTGATLFLEERVMDPKKDEEWQDVLEALLHGLSQAGAGHRTSHLSVGKVLGLREKQPKSDNLKPAMSVYDAAPVGEYPPVMTCEGMHGRPVHCRALVSDAGRLVGYRAYDTLSREFTEEALHVVYDLAGRLAGHLREGRHVDGIGRKHVMTAPEVLEPLAKIEAKKIAV